jgi:hypothetical protein
MVVEIVGLCLGAKIGRKYGGADGVVVLWGKKRILDVGSGGKLIRMLWD